MRNNSISSFWLSQDETDRSDVGMIRDDSLDASKLEIDLEYPGKLDNLRTDYPLAPEKLEIRQHILSNYWK